jgi:hypothetical protein
MGSLWKVGTHIEAQLEETACCKQHGLYLEISYFL